MVFCFMLFSVFSLTMPVLLSGIYVGQCGNLLGFLFQSHIVIFGVFHDLCVWW